MNSFLVLIWFFQFQNYSHAQQPPSAQPGGANPLSAPKSSLDGYHLDASCPFSQWAKENAELDDPRKILGEALQSLKDCAANDAAMVSDILSGSKASTGPIDQGGPMGAPVGGGSSASTCLEQESNAAEEYAYALTLAQKGSAVGQNSPYANCFPMGEPPPAPGEDPSAGKKICLDLGLEKTRQDIRKTCKQATATNIEGNVTAAVVSLASRLGNTHCSEDQKASIALASVSALGALSSYVPGVGKTVQSGLGALNSLISIIKNAKTTKEIKNLNDDGRFPKIACLYYNVQKRNAWTGGCRSEVRSMRREVRQQIWLKN